MKKIFLYKILVVSVLCAISSPGKAQNKATDSLFLLHFYETTGGPTWEKNWDFAAGYKNLHGLSFDENERLTGIALPANKLSGRLPAGPWPDRLQSLEIPDNRINDTLPDKIFALSSFKVIDISGNQFYDSIPALLFPSAFSVFKISRNRFEGELPATLSNAKNLQIIEAAHNLFTGELPAGWGALSSLQVVDLQGNKIEGLIPESFYALRNLQKLNLADNLLKARIDTQCANWQKLEELNLARNNCFDALPFGLTSLRELRILDLSDNGFILLLPASIGNLGKIEYFDLSNNFFTGPLRDGIGSFSEARHIDLSGNTLSGTFFSFYNLTKLEYLDLSDNDLSGPLENSLISRLQSIEYLNLSKNVIGSPLPVNIGECKNLSYLNLSKNKFFGTIPVELKDAESLTFIDFSNNFFEGDFPDISSLNALNYLYLNRNNLSGLPALHNPELKHLKTENNRFTFEDFEPNMQAAATFSYVPQDSARIVTDCYLETQTGGQFNEYQWFKDSLPLPDSNRPVWKAAEKGTYSVKISNPKVPGLVFFSPQKYIFETLPLTNVGPDREYFCGPFMAEIPGGGESGDRFLWSTGDTSRLLSVSRGGMYTLEVSRGKCVSYDTIKIIYRGISDNIIGESRDICTESRPELLTGSLSAEGLSPRFNWQASSDKKNWKTVSFSENYRPPFLSSITHFRRIVAAAPCENDTSNVVTVRISNMKTETEIAEISCFGAKDGALKVTVRGGLPPYRFAWADGSGSPERSGLDSGNYALTITDAIGCERRVSYSLAMPTLFEIRPEVVQASCSDASDGGSIRLNISGGTPPYRILWSDGKAVSDRLNIPSAAYSAEILDARNCRLNFATEISRSRTNDTRFSYDRAVFCAEENPPTAKILGEPKGVFLAVPEGLKLDTLSGEILPAESVPGIYTVIYRLNDCSESAFELEISGSCAALLPNTFSPNGDGLNDTFELPLLADYPAAFVRIFDQTGREIFLSEAGYPEAWTGQNSAGIPLPIGAYYYLINLGNKQTIKGFVNLIR